MPHASSFNGFLLKPSDVHILTEMKRVGANADAIMEALARAANISVQELAQAFEKIAENDEGFMREWFQRGFKPVVKGPMQRSVVIEDVAYAIDVLAEFYNLTPSGARGQYEITYDWDTSMIESSTEAFAQMSELQSRGMVSKAELRQWVRGGTLEEAQEAIDEIDASSESQSAIDRILMQNVPDLGGGDE